MKASLSIIAVIVINCVMQAQNVGIGVDTPAARLHIKGAADKSQIVIDASEVQTNLQPLLRLRDAVGNDRP